MMKTNVKSLTLTLLCMLMAVAAAAQVTIKGKVTDETGSPVGFATVMSSPP